MTCGAVAREISPKRECPAKSPSKSPGTFPTRCGNAITSSSLRIRSRTSPERTGRPGFLRHLPGPEQTEASAMPRYDRFRPVPGELVRYQGRSEEHTSELQSHSDLVCRLLLEKKNNKNHEPDV